MNPPIEPLDGFATVEVEDFDGDGAAGSLGFAWASGDCSSNLMLGSSAIIAISNPAQPS